MNGWVIFGVILCNEIIVVGLVKYVINVVVEIIVVSVF